jgi:ribosome-associated protein
MRQLDPDLRQAARAALEDQNKGSARETQALHLAEKWRAELVANEDALARWLAQFPDTDTQQLRALIRQARKDNPPDKAAESKGLAPRHSRAWRELFQLVREQLGGPSEGDDHDGEDNEEDQA